VRRQDLLAVMLDQEHVRPVGELTTVQ